MEEEICYIGQKKAIEKSKKKKVKNGLCDKISEVEKPRERPIKKNNTSCQYQANYYRSNS